MNLREQILESCFSRYEGSFAGGQSANNKLDMERIADTQLERYIVGILGKFVIKHSPDFVVGVPDGATGLAEKIGNDYGLTTVRLKKIDGETGFRSETDRALCESSKRGVLIEDVVNKYTNTRRALAIPEIGERIVAVEAIWDRGSESERESLALPVNCIISEPIPASLPEDSQLWEHA